jgi:iron complex transport system substrate-binding protein
MKKSLVATVVVGVMALVLSACGGSDDQVQSADSAPTTLASAATSVPGEAAEYPSRIISLSPTHTEMLYAIGAGDQVIAVDAFSNYPPEAAAKLTDLSGFEPNVEAIAGYEPDLVITEGTNSALIAQLDALQIPHWSGPAVSNFEEVFAQIEELGALTGRSENARFVVGEMLQEIEQIRSSLPTDGPALTYYHELDPSYFSVTSDTFIGYVYAQLGMTSIADAAAGAGGQYPQLNAEFIIDADPDLILLACTKYCGETADSVSARPGWAAMSAVQAGRVLEMDDDIASRWGPRIVEYFAAVAAAVTELLATASGR